ncbi:MAG TPA: hypothetical protein VGD13_12280 [Xanthobacteraceae bacterium]|jgi:general secretion pathway protein J
MSPRKHLLGEADAFTLVEVLAATVLMGAILAALGNVTGHWLPNWNRGFAAAQRLEALALGLERIAEDIASAEFIPAGGEGSFPVFQGTERSIVFVRTSVGPGGPSGLEFVRFAETESDGVNVVRSRAAYAPVAPSGGQSNQPNWADPVVLIRPPHRITFSFSGPDRVWQKTWSEARKLPRAVRITVSAGGQALSFSTSTRVHAEFPAACVGLKNPASCLKDEQDKPAEPEAPAKRSELSVFKRGAS